MSKKRKHRKAANFHEEHQAKATALKEPGISGKAETEEKPVPLNQAEEYYRSGMNYAEGAGVNRDDSKAVELFRKAAELGHAEAQYQLGDCYRLGKGLEKDNVAASSWLEKAALQGHAKAQNVLGMHYRLGRGVEQDYAKAAYWVEKAALQGLDIAQNNIGYFYKYGQGVEKDLEKAIHYYELSAEQGYAQAQFGLGQSYMDGVGVERDKEKAAYWFEKAAQQGLSTAQESLGSYYYFSYKYPEAVFWFQKAADQGNRYGMFKLGLCYLEGRLGEKDYEQAAFWFAKAKEKDVFGADTRLKEALQHLEESKAKNTEVLYRLGRDFYYGKEKDYKKAFQYYLEAAEQGHAPSQCEVGDCYYFGDGIEKDVSMAVHWYELSARQGYAIAQYRLGGCYNNGYFVQEDRNKAIYWFELSAKQGNPDAQYSLALIYHYSHNDKDAEKAVYWLEKSAEQGNSISLQLLAKHYLYGKGVEEDKEKGTALMKQAAEAGNSEAISYFSMQEYMNRKLHWVIPENVIRKGADGKYYFDIKDKSGNYSNISYYFNLNEERNRILGCRTLIDFGDENKQGFDSNYVWNSENVTVVFAGFFIIPFYDTDNLHALLAVKNDNPFEIDLDMNNEEIAIGDTYAVISQNITIIQPKTMVMLDISISTLTDEHLDPEHIDCMQLPLTFMNNENDYYSCIDIDL